MPPKKFKLITIKDYKLKQIDFPPDPNFLVRHPFKTLLERQKKIGKYFKDGGEAVLTIWGTGVGKTLASIAATEGWLEANPTGNVIIITPANLVTNMLQNLREYNVKYLERYKVLSYQRYVNQKDKIDCKNNMLVIDEAHSLADLKSNRYKAAYSCAQHTNARLLLTATPFRNTMFDFVSLINLLYAFPVICQLKAKRFKSLNDEEEELGDTDDVHLELHEKDTDEPICVHWMSRGKSNSKLNMAKIMELLKGHVSFIKGVTEDFPTFTEHADILVMSDDFHKQYYENIKPSEGLFGENPAAFYHGYRRATNVIKANPKLEWLQKKFLENPKTKMCIYTTWLSYGTNLIQKALEPLAIKYNIPFYVYRGSRTVKDQIVEDYNSDSNGIIIITKSASEGISFKGVREMIVYDPTFTDSQMKQIIGRAIRHKSHSHLPEKDRHVDVYYLVTIEKKYYIDYITHINNFKNTIWNLSAEMPLSYGNWTNTKSGDAKVYNIVLIKEWLNYRVEKQLQYDAKFKLEKKMDTDKMITNITQAFNELDKFKPANDEDLRDVDTNYIAKLEIYKSFLNVDATKKYRDEGFNKEDMKTIKSLYQVSLKNDLYETPSIYSEFIYQEVLNQTIHDAEHTYDILEPACGLGSLMIPFLFNKNFNITMNDIADDVIKLVKPLSKIEGVKVEHGDFLEQNNKKKYDFIIMNPPFSGSYKGKKVSNLYGIFVAKGLQMLKPKGRLYVICPMPSSVFEKIGKDANQNNYKFLPSETLGKKIQFNYNTEFMTDLGSVTGFRKISNKTLRPVNVFVEAHLLTNVIEGERIRTLQDISTKQTEMKIAKREETQAFYTKNITDEEKQEKIKQIRDKEKDKQEGYKAFRSGKYQEYKAARRTVK